MASPGGSRRSAAESLLSKMGGAMTDPEADEEMAPGPEAPMEDMPLPEEGAMPPPEGEQGVDLEGALSGVEAAIQGLPEDAAMEVRSHIEAIRDIASRGGAAEPQSPGPEGLPAAPESTVPPESPDSGMERLPM